MSASRDVWQALSELVERGGDGALVTIAATEGSAYQREGTKLLYRHGADPVGTISGGCLEADVFEHCEAAIGSGVPAIVRYATGGARDTLLGGGTGCEGRFELVVEPVLTWRTSSARALLAAIGERVAASTRFVLASVIRQGDDIPRVIPRVLTDPGGAIVMQVADAALRDWMVAEARQALADDARRPSRKVARSFAGTRAEVFLDVTTPPLELVVFGAGDDARPLVRIAAASGFRVTIADWRENLLATERFPDASAIVRLRPEEFPGGISLRGSPAIVLMTHNYLADRDALAHIVERSIALRYLGVLGPRARTARLLTELERPRLDVRTPAGLDIGADTPEEIALSIVAEILAVDRARSGRPLREVRDDVSSKG